MVRVNGPRGFHREGPGIHLLLVSHVDGDPAVALLLVERALRLRNNALISVATSVVLTHFV